MEVAALGLRVESDQVKQGADALSGLADAAEKAEKSTSGFSKGADKARKSSEQLRKSADDGAKSVTNLAQMAARAGVLLGAALSVTVLRNYVDGWSDMQSQVGAAVKNMDAAPRLMQRIVDVANASYSPLQQTVAIYSQNVSVLGELGRSAQEAADFTESLNHMLVITATKGQQAESVQSALSKAMAVGKLQADGLETVLANGGRVAEALAKELNTTTNGLRGMASQGKITSAVIANAVVGSLQEVRKEADAMPATMGDAFQRIQTNLTELVGRLDQTTGSSGAVAQGLIGVADTIRAASGHISTFAALAAPAFDTIGSAISTVSKYADIAVIALAGFYAPAMMGGISLLVTALGVGLVGAIRAVTAAMLANPIGLFVSALATAGYAVYKFRDQIYEAIGVDVVQTARTAANYVIGSFVAAYEDLKFVFGNFGSIVGGAVIGGVNVAVRAINSLIQGVTTRLDSLVESINDVLGTNLGTLGAGAAIKEMENPYADTLVAALEDRNKKIAEALSRDYLGELASSFKKLTPVIEDGTEVIKDSSSTLNDNSKALAEAAKAAKRFAEERATAFKKQYEGISDLQKERRDLEDQIRTFGQGKRAIEQLAISRLREQAAVLAGFKGSKEVIELLRLEIEEREKLLQAGFTLDGLESGKKAAEDLAEAAKRTHDEIERSLTDALMRGFESGKDFGRNFIDTLKNMFGSLVLRPIIQPIAAGAAGMLGFGGIANASTVLGGGGLGGFNLLTGFAGSSAGLVQSVGGSLASINGSLGDFGANLVMNADKIGGALDMAGAGLAYGASLYQMTQGKWGAGLGGAAGQFLGGPIGSFIGSQLGGMLDKAFKGETRSGGGFVYDPNSRRAMYHSGPSGGYGGQQTLSAVESLFSSAADTIVHVFEGAGVDAGLAFFHGAFESSSKGRGGTFSGGDIVLADGSVIGFGGAKKGDGFGGKSGSTEEMFANLQAEMHFSVLEAWKTVGTQMPQVIRDMLNGVDIRSLSAEQAQAAVVDISALTGQVTTLTAALNTLPIENLKNLSFDLAYGLGQASGGMEALAANSVSFYQGFYSEAERQEHLHRQLVDVLATVNVQLPATREGFRRLVDSLGEVSSANQETVAALLGAANAADQYYSQLEQRQEQAHQEQLRRQQEAYQEARSQTDRLMSAFRELAQQQIRELQQASSLTDKVVTALQKSLNTQISSLTSVSSLLSNMVSELRGSVGLFEMQAAEGWRVIGNTLSTGVIPDADTLRNAISSVRADFNDQFYESAFERQRDQLVLANQLESINALAKPQLSIAEMQLQVMQDQLAELREGTKRAFELAGLSQVQIAAIKSVDDKTATGVGLTKDQLEALRTSNSASAVLQNLTREQIQGILGVKSETSSLYGLSQSQIEAMREVDLNTQTVAELTKRLQTAMEAEGLANRQIDTIQSQLKTMQSQYDQLRGLNTTMTSLDQGMRLLAVAMKAEQAAKPPTTGSGTGSGALQFGDQAYKLKNQSEARNYILSNTGLLGAFASEVSSGWTTASDYLKYAQDHYSRFGWSEGRSSSGPRNLGRTHKPGTYSEAQAYLANNSDLLDYYLDLVSSDKSFAGDRGMLAYAQQHYDAYGKSELRKYARGGDHPGGLRLVGELGPELEMTGPSRIMSANRTQSLLNQSLKGPDLTGFIHSLIRETQELRRMYENLMRSMIAMQQRTARVLERWEGDEYPVRVEEMPFEPVVVKVKKEVA